LATLSGQKKLLELAAQSATFDLATVHEFFDNPNSIHADENFRPALDQTAPE
jgi:hypothetical protein